jgi:hypothetical protein
MQPAVALIGDGKHDKNKDEGANELEWGMGDIIRSMPRSSLERRRQALTSSKKQLADVM